MADEKNLDESLDLDDLLGLTDDDNVKVSPTAESDDVDELLNDIAPVQAERTTEAAEKPVDAPVAAVEASVELTADELRIKELEAALEEPSPFEGKLTPAQLRIKDLEQQLAEKNNAAIEQAESAPVEYAPAATGETILLHFLQDGLIVCGQTWYRGQELEFEKGSPAHEQQLNKAGKSWLDLLDDIDGQYERWGTQYIASGPWRGKGWADAPVPADMTDPAEITAYQAGIRKAASAERLRNRAAPLIR